MFISLPAGTMYRAPSDSRVSVSVAFAGVVLFDLLFVFACGVGGLVVVLFVSAVVFTTVGGLVSALVVTVVAVVAAVTPAAAVVDTVVTVVAVLDVCVSVVGVGTVVSAFGMLVAFLLLFGGVDMIVITNNK